MSERLRCRLMQQISNVKNKNVKNMIKNISTISNTLSGQMNNTGIVDVFKNYTLTQN